MSYNAEAAGRAVASFSYSRQRLSTHLDGLAEVIDLDTACRPLPILLKRRLSRLIRDSHQPAYNPQTPGRYPDPNQLLLEVLRLREDGQMKEAHLLSRT